MKLKNFIFEFLCFLVLLNLTSLKAQGNKKAKIKTIKKTEESPVDEPELTNRTPVKLPDRKMIQSFDLTNNQIKNTSKEVRLVNLYSNLCLAVQNKSISLLQNGQTTSMTKYFLVQTNCDLIGNSQCFKVTSGQNGNSIETKIGAKRYNMNIVDKSHVSFELFDALKFEFQISKILRDLNALKITNSQGEVLQVVSKSLDELVVFDKPITPSIEQLGEYDKMIFVSVSC